MQNVKNIIFDYGNVIFNIDFRNAQQAFAKLGLTNAEEFYGQRQQDQIFDKFDRGEVSGDEFRSYIRQFIGNPDVTDKQIDDAWNSLLLGIAPGTHDLLLQLKG